MIIENRKRIKRVLEWLKAELEYHYEVRESSLIPRRYMLLGKTSYRFIFESSQVSVDIWYWNTGIIYMGAVDMTNNDLFMDIRFVPDDHATNNYPENSETVLRGKIKELLINLHHKKHNILMNLPVDI